MLDLDTGFKYEEILDDGSGGQLRDDQQEHEFEKQARALNGVADTSYDQDLSFVAPLQQVLSKRNRSPLLRWKNQSYLTRRPRLPLRHCVLWFPVLCR